MPAPASCPITLPDDLLDDEVTDLIATAGPSLLAALRTVADPRDPRGVRHDFATILTLAVAAMLTGARGYAALWRWSAQTLPATRAALAVTGPIPIPIPIPIPSEKTIRVTLQNTEPDVLNYAIATWLAQHLQHLQDLRERGNTEFQAAEESTAVTVIAVDGKTVRGSRDGDTPGTHLLAAFNTTHGVPLDQVDVDAKTNEITYLPTLLKQLKDR